MESLSVVTPVQGVIVYEGPSQLDGKPITAVITGIHNPSTNQKTGPMPQTFVLRSDVSPLEAQRSGQDVSICGECPHRRMSNDCCYVNVSRSPTNVWKAYRRGRYPAMRPGLMDLFRNRSVRLSAYGDPAAVPYEIWRPILEVAGRWTGYTHQWRTCDPRCRDFMMASCDGVREYQEARALGWRTFRIRTADAPLQPGEFICPASDEAGSRLTCDQCCACNGTKMGQRPQAYSPVIVAHGSKASRFRTAA